MRIVICNCPPDEADGLARALVEERLAACVNIAPAVRSVYVWEGAVQDEVESTLVAKVPEARLDAAVSRLQELHSYDVPEVLALPVDTERSSKAYVDWVRGIAG